MQTTPPNGVLYLVKRVGRKVCFILFFVSSDSTSIFPASHALLVPTKNCVRENNITVVQLAAYDEKTDRRLTYTFRFRQVSGLPSYPVQCSTILVLEIKVLNVYYIYLSKAIYTKMRL